MENCKRHPKKSEMGDLIFQETCLEHEGIIFDIFEDLTGLEDETVFFFFYIIHEAPRSKYSSRNDRDFIVNLIESSKQVLEIKTQISISEDQEEIVKGIIESHLAPNRDIIGEISGHFVQKAYKKEIDEATLYEAYILTETENLHPKDDPVDITCIERNVLIECKLNLSGEDVREKADEQIKVLNELSEKLEEYDRSFSVGIVDFSLRQKEASLDCLDRNPKHAYTLYDFYDEKVPK